MISGDLGLPSRYDSTRIGRLPSQSLPRGAAETWRIDVTTRQREAAPEGREADTRLRGAAEVQPWCSRDIAEIKPRHGRDMAEIWPRAYGKASGSGPPPTSPRTTRQRAGRATYPPTGSGKSTGGAPPPARAKLARKRRKLSASLLEALASGRGVAGRCAPASGANRLSSCAASRAGGGASL